VSRLPGDASKPRGGGLHQSRRRFRRLLQDSVVGVSISGDRRTVLSIGLVYRGQAIPVAWKVLLATVLHPWEPEWRALVRGFSGAVAPGHMPIVLTDLLCTPARSAMRSEPGLTPGDADHTAEPVPRAGP
jgi:hypothetical protein